MTRRPRDYWIINFNGFEESAAARYEAPFELLKREIALYEAERGRKITRPDFLRFGGGGPISSPQSAACSVIPTTEVAKAPLCIVFLVHIRAETLAVR